MLVASAAELPASDTVPRTELPSLNVTVPVTEGVMVAVNVTVAPVFAGFDDEMSVVTVDTVVVTWLVLFLGAGTARRKSFALSFVSSAPSRLVGDPAISMRRRAAWPGASPIDGLSGLPTPDVSPA